MSGSAGDRMSQNKKQKQNHHHQPLLQVGSVHVNATYDEEGLLRSEARWREDGRLLGERDVLTFWPTTSGEAGGTRTALGCSSDVLDLLPMEPVFAFECPSERSGEETAAPYRPRQGCYVASSLNHMYLTRKEMLSSSRLAGEELRLLSDEAKRAALQRKYRLRLIGFSVGDFSLESAKKGRFPQVACNCGGLMTVKADEPCQVGDHIVVDFPLKNLNAPSKRRTNACFPRKGVPDDKVTMVVRPLEPAKDFAASALPASFQPGSEFGGAKYPPWVVGICIRGCAQAGETIDLRYSSQLRYPNVLTPVIGGRPLTLLETGGTSYEEVCRASMRRALLTMGSRSAGLRRDGDYTDDDDDDDGGGSATLPRLLPSLDCVDLFRYAQECTAREKDMDNSNLSVVDGSADVLGALRLAVEALVRKDPEMAAKIFKLK
tara:strand:+ start:141 stop:1439 length:1299 start_codon:yes stop_codon:yes gene_type:complete